MYGNCNFCGIFARLTPNKLCKDCQIVDEQLIQEAREILRNEGQVSVFEIAERLSIPPRHVFNWVESGRISQCHFHHLCPLCGKDMLNNGCDCTKSRTPPEEEAPVKFHSAIRIAERRRKYWEEKSKIKRKQKKDIWIVT
jgi:hypothetical protein